MLLWGYQRYASSLATGESGPTEWAPFSTRREWEIARWAKLRGPSSTALTELLEIDGVSWPAFVGPTGTKCYFFQLPEALGLSFKSSEELNKIIDKKLPNGLPQFIREEVELGGQKYEFYHRDILQCVQVLYGDPELAECLAYAPEQHFTGPDKKSQIFSEMNSGRWWWTRQVGSCLVFFTSLT